MEPVTSCSLNPASFCSSELCVPQPALCVNKSLLSSGANVAGTKELLSGFYSNPGSEIYEWTFRIVM